MKKKNIKLRIAFGLESRNKFHLGELDNYLNNLPKMKIKGTYHYEYTANKKKYDIRMLFTKKEFLKALDEPEAIVFYDGHSRYGQGPAFSEKANVGLCPDNDAFPTFNPWEDHVRMGWDVVITKCLMDIHRHGTHPKEHTSGKIPKWTPKRVKYFHKTAVNNEKRKVKCDSKNIIKKRRFNDCFPSMAKLVNCRNKKSLNGRSFWKIKNRKEREKLRFRDDIENEYLTLVKGGASDLKKSKFQCSVLFMRSCSSIKHYYCALRQKRMEIQKKPCVFYLTQYPSWSRARALLLFVTMVLAGKDPTRKKDARYICRKINSVNSNIFKMHKIKRASGVVRFSTGKKLEYWEKNYLRAQWESNSCKESHWKGK